MLGSERHTYKKAGREYIKVQDMGLWWYGRVCGKIEETELCEKEAIDA
jgi:hypothetical protein